MIEKKPLGKKHLYSNQLLELRQLYFARKFFYKTLFACITFVEIFKELNDKELIF